MINKQGVTDFGVYESQNQASIKKEDMPLNNNLLKNTYFTSSPGTYAVLDTTKTFNGYPCIKMSQSGNESNVYRGYSQTVTGVNAGDVITITGWIYVEDKTAIDNGFEFRVYQTHNDGSATNWAGCYDYSKLKEHEWVRFTKTYTLDSNLQTAIYNWQVTKNGTFWLACPKVEFGSVATSWTPNPADTIYDKYNYNSAKTLNSPIMVNTFYEY